MKKSYHFDYFSTDIDAYEEDDCLQLVDLCQITYKESSDDKWRLLEWPFASREAAIQEYASLLIGRDVTMPDNAYSIRVKIRDSWETAGVITLSFHGFDGDTGWIGTYIAPPYRGYGLQKLAKERIFSRMPSSIRGFYGMIATTNTSSIHAAKKLQYCEWIPPEKLSSHPSPVQNAYLREQGRILIVFYHLSGLRV